MMKGDSKTFKFMSNDNLSSLNSFYNAPSQIRASQRIRVEAGAGDKCVAQAKSKMRKRKGVAPPDPGGLSLDCIDWSTELYSPREIVKDFGKRLPLVVRVVGNFHSPELDLDFSSGQVIQLYNSGEQERLHVELDRVHLAKLSLPLSSEIEVHTIDPISTDHQKLEDLLEISSLPVQVEVHHVNQDAHGTVLDLVSKKLTLIKKVTDVFLRGNFINDGWVDQQPILMIPSHLNIEFEIAFGMHGASDAEWEDYCGMFARSARHINFKNTTGYKGVIDLDINPHVTEDIRENKDELSTQRKRENSPVICISNEKSNNDSFLVSEPIRDPVYANLEVHTQNISNKSPDEFSNSPLYASNIQKENTMVEVHSKEISSKTNMEYPKYESSINIEQINYQNHAYKDTENDNDSGEALELTQMFDKVIEIGTEDIEKSPPDRQSYTYVNGHMSPVGSYLCENEFIYFNKADSRTSLLPSSPESLNNESQTSPVLANIYEIKTDVNYDTTTGWNVLKRIKNLQEVPSNLSALSIYQVSDCLILFGMKNHVKDFEQHKVDGKKLSKLKESSFQKDFSMNAFNANKLSRFVRGWRPSSF